jgi:Voltage gated chloride channel
VIARTRLGDAAVGTTSLFGATRAAKHALYAHRERSCSAQGGTWDHHPSFKWLRRFKNDSQRRDFVTCGASAGVAAAFRAPVGGVLFGLEELSTHWSEHLLLTCFFTTAVVNVTVRLLMSYCSGGGCGFFGEGKGEEGSTIIFHMKDYQARC